MVSEAKIGSAGLHCVKPAAFFSSASLQGVYEFWALHSALQHTADQRPLTHAALLRTIDALGATLKSVIIDRLIGPDPVFGANLRISHATHDISVDVRPSDAVILAVRTNVPIVVDHNIFISEMR